MIREVIRDLSRIYRVKNAADNVFDLARRMPTGEEVRTAARALTAIQDARRDDGTLEVGGVRLSAALTEQIEVLFGIFARGDTVTFMPVGRMLSTQQAADLLNVSRTHLIKMVEAGDLEVEMVGTHRRIPFEALMEFKEQRSISRRAALKRLQQLGEEFDAS
jgi:excisionase family DNA binding protein